MEHGDTTETCFSEKQEDGDQSEKGEFGICFTVRSVRFLKFVSKFVA
jgi:hypothetical protein